LTITNRRSREQVRIHVTNASAKELLSANEAQDFVMLGDSHWAQLLQQTESLIAVRKSAASDLSNYERVYYHAAATKVRCKFGYACAKVVDPYGRIDQNHEGVAARLLGTGLSRGWVPPSFASRRALSRSISAFNPLWSTAERSRTPVSLIAFASSSSSSVTVVRMVPPGNVNR
jgi:hypothetical protein